MILLMPRGVGLRATRLPGLVQCTVPNCPGRERNGQQLVAVKASEVGQKSYYAASDVRWGKFGGGFLVNMTHASVVATVQLVRAERFPIMNRPSVAKSARLSPVSLLKSSAVMQTDASTGKFVNAD